MKKLLTAKYDAAKTATGKMISSSWGEVGVCGRSSRNKCAATHMAVAAAQILKAARTFKWRRLLAQVLRMTASSVTMMVAAEGPNSRTAANTNASETEILAFIDGSLMLKEPVRNASRARNSHWKL